MATDLTPRVIGTSDTSVLEPGGLAIKRLTRVVYMLGTLGPFTADFAEGAFTESNIREAMRAKADALRSFTA